jgi:flagellar biosynthetic protein FliR
VGLDFFSLTYRQVETFLLILTRVTTLFLVAPVFGSRNLPLQIKVAFSLAVSLLLLFATAPITLERSSTSVFNLAGNVAGEFVVGLAISYSAYLLFAGIQMAGQIIDIQMGFGLVNVIDPQSNTQVSILGQFYYLLSILVFLALDGHHVLLRAVGDSFHLVPVAGLPWIGHAAAAGPVISEFFTRLFVIAFQIAAPAVATLFLTTLAMGILSRTVPQMNVFIVGLPLSVLVGLFITFFSIELLGTVLHGVVSTLAQSITQLLRALAA